MAQQQPGCAREVTCEAARCGGKVYRPFYEVVLRFVGEQIVLGLWAGLEFVVLTVIPQLLNACFHDTGGSICVYASLVSVRWKRMA